MFVWQVDFIEVPSTLLEKFALHPEVAQRYAKHNGTGEALPTQVLRQWLRGEKAFKALAMQGQVALACSDQAIHRYFHPGAKDVSDIFLEQMEEHMLIPHVRGT